LVGYAQWRLRLGEGGQELAKNMDRLTQFLGAIKQMGVHVKERSKTAAFDTSPPELKIPDVSRAINRRMQNGR
jgi:hypothetical protein